MTRKLAEYLANKALLSQSGSGLQLDALVYGFELLVSTVWGIILTALVSVIVGYSLAWIPFILGFSRIRTTAGGYHAKTHMGCYCVFTAIFSIALILTQIILLPTFFPVIASLISLLILFLWSPIAAKNKPLTAKSKHKNRKRSLVIIATDTIAAVPIMIYHISNMYVNLFYLGILATATSMVVAKFINEGEKIT